MKKIVRNFKVKTLVKVLICIVAISACVGCSNTIEIEQEVLIDSFIEGTYCVKTNVWVRDWKGFALALESREIDWVKGDLVDSLKTEQLIKAEQIKIKLLPLVKH